MHSPQVSQLLRICKTAAGVTSKFMFLVKILFPWALKEYFLANYIDFH